MKLAGWVLLPFGLVGVGLTVALMMLAFYRLMATAGAASPSSLSDDLKIALVPFWLGIGLSIAGLVLLFLGRRADRRRSKGFPVGDAG